MKYLLLLLAGCSSPDAITLTPSYGSGSIYPRGGDDVDTDVYGVAVGLTWSLGLQRDAYRSLDRMRFTDRNAIWTDTKEPPPLPVIVQDAETGEELNIIPDEVPTDPLEALAYVIYVAGLVLLAYGALHFGVPAWKAWRANGVKRE